jgi:hypothetical protein
MVRILYSQGDLGTAAKGKGLRGSSLRKPNQRVYVHVAA